MSLTTNLDTQTTEWVVKTIKLAQACQKSHGQNHPLWPVWSEAIHACCAEMDRRCKAGEPEALAATL